MSPVPPIKRPRLNNRSRGQVMVIFVAAILTFVGLCAIVVDVSWYWANTLRAQRAADAAALAGAVYLPADSGVPAFAEAQKAAVRNGYTNGVGGVKVTPFVDADDPRQLDVRVEGQVQSFFAQALRHQGMAGLAHRRGRLHPARPDGQPGRLLRRRRLLDERRDDLDPRTSGRAPIPGLNTATTAPGTARGRPRAGRCRIAVRDDDPSGNDQNRPTRSPRPTVPPSAVGEFGLTSQLAAQPDGHPDVNGFRVFLDDMFLSENCSSTRRIYVAAVVGRRGTTGRRPRRRTTRTTPTRTSTRTRQH